MKIRALVLADDCNPEWPSWPVVGYKACRSIADHAEVVVATHVRNRPQIERDGMGRGRVVYLNNEYIAAPMHKAATA
ncbi:MAG: glycosyl transferase family 1, partial [Phycisphaerales bacterium]|nr:glycosyl transferase family 1 [Phycisphaerales bacterium]